MNPTERLTLTEVAVLCGWAKGWTNREVGLALGDSVNTIKTLAERIYNKLGVHTQAAAVSMWDRRER